MKVYPVAGGRVKHPRTLAVMPPEGWDVPDNDFYWLRRLAHGDVTTEAPGVAVASTARPNTSAEEAPQ